MSWKIPLYKIYHDEDDVKAVESVIRRGSHWTNGSENADLEKMIAGYTGKKHAVTFNNGTAALHAMLLSFGIGPEDEVIVPSFTFISTANSVLFTGAQPVFADIEPDTYALDAEDVRKRITEKTRAILPIHYGGLPAIQINELREIAEDNGILLLEDAAESLGAKLQGKNVGSFGESAIFSFCANKIITSGEGGAVVTDSEDIYEMLKLYRSHGRAENENYFDSAKSMDYIQIGYNFRMSSITAALALSQMKKIDKIIELRRKAANIYDKLLAEYVISPQNNEEIFNVYQMYSVRFKNKEQRDMVKTALTNAGVMCKVYFDPVHQTHFYKNVLGQSLTLDITEKISGEILSLPIFPDINEEEISYVADIIKNSLIRN